MPSSIINIKKIVGADSRETAGSDSWYWIKDKANFKFNIFGDANSIQIKFDLLVASGPRDLKIVLKNENKISHTEIISFDDGWSKFTSEKMNLKKDKIDTKDIFEIIFSASGEGVRLSENDARVRKFLIKNLQILVLNR